MINIECVNAEQKRMLDKIWQFNSLDEYQEWTENLDEVDQFKAFALAKMLHLALVDNEVESMINYPDVRE